MQRLRSVALYRRGQHRTASRVQHERRKCWFRLEIGHSCKPAGVLRAGVCSSRRLRRRTTLALVNVRFRTDDRFDL